jgi:hypothetical protein
VTERITVDEPGRRVVFTLVDHPVFDGAVVNEVTADNGGLLSLTFTLDWRVKREEDADTDMMPMVQGAVLHTKELAERRG